MAAEEAARRARGEAEAARIESASLRGELEEAKQGTLQGRRLSGCFVLTAMNHVAATAAGFAETTVSAADAVVKLEREAKAACSTA